MTNRVASIYSSCNNWYYFTDFDEIKKDTSCQIDLYIKVLNVCIGKVFFQRVRARATLTPIDKLAFKNAYVWCRSLIM